MSERQRSCRAAAHVRAAWAKIAALTIPRSAASAYRWSSTIHVGALAS